MQCQQPIVWNCTESVYLDATCKLTVSRYYINMLLYIVHRTLTKRRSWQDRKLVN